MSQPDRFPIERPAADSVPRGVRVAAAWSWRVLLVLVVGVALTYLLAISKVIWVSVVIALLLTVLLTPVIDLLDRRLRFPRALASGVAVVGMLGLLGGLATLAGREVIRGFAALWDQAEAGLASLTAYLADGPFGLDPEAVDQYLEQASDQIGDNAGTIMSGALSFTGTLLEVLLGAVITIFCLIFFLKDGAVIWAWLLRLLPRPSRHPVYEASRRAWRTLGAYIKTQILIAAVNGVGVGLGAAILGLPLAVPLGTLVFLGGFVPFVGAIVTGAVAVLVALVDQGIAIALVMLLIVIAVQQIEGNVLEPLLMGHAVSLHPVAVLLAVTAGSLAAGIVGALLAVPIVATLNTMILYLRGRDKFPELGSDPGGLDRWIAQLDDVTNSRQRSAEGGAQA
jgi:predicted PurR-regulated permease PerM